jgi:hypothetical protein
MKRKLPLPPGALINSAIRGNPPRIQEETNEFIEQIHWGLFVSAMEVVGIVKMFHYSGYEQILSDLTKYQNQSRILHLTDAEPDDSDYYSIELLLPMGGDLGVSFVGFPPIVSAVSEGSPIRSILQEGMQVERFLIPKLEFSMSLGDGGFTNYRLVKALDEHREVEGGILVVSSRKQTVRAREPWVSKFIWDLNAFRNTSKWSIRRILSNRPSQYLEEEIHRCHEYQPLSTYSNVP